MTTVDARPGSLDLRLASARNIGLEFTAGYTTGKTFTATLGETALTVTPDGDTIQVAITALQLSAIGETPTRFKIFEDGLPLFLGWIFPSDEGSESPDDTIAVTVNSVAVTVTTIGSGGSVASVNGATGAVVLDADDIDDTSTTNKFATAAELSKLAGIEAGADVTDVANVEAAGAVMDTDIGTTVQAHSAVLDATTASFTTADETKLDGIEAGAQVNTVDSVAGQTGAVTLAKADVGLGNVDNTADVDKPISTATQAALDAKAPDVEWSASVNLSTNPTVTEDTRAAVALDGAGTVTVNVATGRTADLFLLAGNPAGYAVTWAGVDVWHTAAGTAPDTTAIPVDSSSRLAFETTAAGVTHGYWLDEPFDVAAVDGLQTALDAKANTADLGTAAAEDVGFFATAAQGATADTALQPGDIDVTVQGYTAVLAGTTASFTTADETKLDGIEAGATADQTAAEVPITDTGAHYTATDTEGALAEIAGRVDDHEAAEVAVSGLPAATTLDGTELVIVEQGGVTSQSTTGDVVADLAVPKDGGGTFDLTSLEGVQFDYGADGLAEVKLSSGRPVFSIYRLADTEARITVGDTTFGAGLLFSDGSSAGSVVGILSSGTTMTLSGPLSGSILSTIVSRSVAATLAATHAGTHQHLTGATGRTFTIPPNATVAFPIGTSIWFRKMGTGDLTIGRGTQRTVTDGATTDTSTTITSATAAFTSADVGRPVTGSGIPAGAYIASVTNGTTAVLSAAATATATGVTLTFLVTIHVPASLSLVISEQYATRKLHKIAADEWVLS